MTGGFYEEYWKFVFTKPKKGNGIHCQQIRIQLKAQITELKFNYETIKARIKELKASQMQSEDSQMQ